MGPIQVVVQDGNNLVLEVTPTPNTTVILDRGIAGPPGPQGPGDVDGPASATDNAIARFDGTTGKLIQNSVVTIGDTGNIAGVGTLAVTDLTDSSLTSGRVTYAGTGGNLVDSANLTFNGTDLTVSGAVNAGSINATTLDLTNLEVTNIKAKDGTSSITLADSTGVASFVANPILSAGVANGVAFLNGSKVLTTGSALTFDGTTVTAGNSGISNGTGFNSTNSTGNSTFGTYFGTGYGSLTSGDAYIYTAKNIVLMTDNAASSIKFSAGGSAEQMRLTSSLLSVVPGATIQGLTVGRGAGAVSSNTAVGASALAANTTGTNHVAVGTQALASNTTGSFNVAVGFQSIVTNTIGSANVGLGNYSIANNTVGSYNTGIGHESLYSVTTASFNTAVGYQAALNNTAEGIVAFGNSALRANTTGTLNTGVGNGALFSNTTGSSNVALGHSALLFNTTASNNTAVGYQAGYSNTTGAAITAFGRQSLYSNTTANYNSAFGDQTLYSNTTGANNVAVGTVTMFYNTTGSNNTSLGQQSLYSNTTASNNTAVGYQAGFSNTAGARNTFLGYQAGYTSNGTGNAGNTAVGAFSGFSLTTGTNNTFIGSGGGCGYFVTTGSNNTIIGAYTGNGGGLDIRTASNYIVLSDGDGNPRAHCTTAGAWYFHNSGGAGSDVVNATCGATAGTGRSLYTGWHTATTPQGGTLSFNVTTNGNVTNTNNSYGAISDIKLKENIVDASPKLADLMQVKIRNYNLKGDHEQHKQIGVVAQELETVFPAMVEETADRDREGNDLGTTTKSVKYSVFVPMLIKAMQEQQAIIESLKARLDAANL